MPPIAESELNRLREAATSDAVARALGVDLRPDGPERRKGSCPFPDHPDSDPSFTVYVTGGWKCYGCDRAGGDGISLWQAATGGDFKAAARELAGRFGIHLDGGNGAHQPSASRPAARRAATEPPEAPAVTSRTWEPSPEPPAELVHPHPPGELAEAWPVRDAEGRLFAAHVRFDLVGDDGAPKVDPSTGKREKTFKWWRAGVWSLGGVSQRDAPLYGSEDVAGWGEAGTVFVVEGERAADALRAIGARALGTVGASVIPRPTAAAVLAGADVVLWPDAHQAGREHMEKVAAAIAPVASSVRVWEPPDAPPKGDAVEWCAERQGRPPDELLSELLADVERSAAPAPASTQGAADRAAGTVLAAEAIADAENRRMQREATGRPTLGIETGLPTFDRVVGGLEPGLILLAAGPGMMKTSLARQWAVTAAGGGAVVVFASFENHPVNLVTAALCARAKLDTKDVRRGLGDMAALRRAADELAPALSRLTVLEGTGALTVAQLAERLERDRDRHRVERGLLVVDYVQLFAKACRDLRSIGETRGKVEALAAELIETSRRLSVPVLAISSLKRKDGGYGDPSLDDLKESGDLEYGGDVALLLANPPAAAPDRHSRALRLIVAKNRNGPSGGVFDLIGRPDLGGQITETETRWS